MNTYIYIAFMGMCDCDNIENIIYHAKEVLCT